MWFQKISIPPPDRGSLEIPRGGGLKRPKFLKESMSPNWNFQRGGGEFKPKKPFVGGGGTSMDIFWNNTIQVMGQNKKKLRNLTNTQR